MSAPGYNPNPQYGQPQYGQPQYGQQMPQQGGYVPQIWQERYLVIKQKVLTIGNKYYIENASGQLLGFCAQKILKLKEDIRIYTDESKTVELLQIKQMGIIDAWGKFQVIDPSTGQTVGYLARKYLKSMFVDEWKIYNAQDMEIATLTESSTWLAVFRRFCSIIQMVPKEYSITDNSGRELAKLKQKFKIIGDTWWLDMTMSPPGAIDSRLVVAIAILMDAVEQVQGA